MMKDSPKETESERERKREGERGGGGDIKTEDERGMWIHR